MPKEKSVGAVVFKHSGKENRFLLLHYGAGHWGFPKGHVERNETEAQTLFREVAEETGLHNVELLRGFKHYTSYFFRREGSTVFKEVVFFLVKAGQGKVRLSHEHKAFQWLPFEEAAKKLTFKNTRNMLRKANAFLQQRSLREF